MIPDVLTVLRGLASVYIVYLARHGEWKFAAVVLLAAGLSDVIDGAIARHWRLRTRLGELDEIADLLYIAAAPVGLLVAKQLSRAEITVVGVVATVVIFLFFMRGQSPFWKRLDDPISVTGSIGVAAYMLARYAILAGISVAWTAGLIIAGLLILIRLKWNRVSSWFSQA